MSITPITPALKGQGWVQNMGQFSVEISGVPGSDLNGNQQVSPGQSVLARRMTEPVCSARSIRATSTSVTPASHSATAFSRHTRFATGWPPSHEPITYRTRDKPHNFTCSRFIPTDYSLSPRSSPDTPEIPMLSRCPVLTNRCTPQVLVGLKPTREMGGS